MMLVDMLLLALKSLHVWECSVCCEDRTEEMSDK